MDSLSTGEVEPLPLLGSQAISLGLPAVRYSGGHGNLEKGPLISTAAPSLEEEFAFVFWTLRTRQLPQKQLPRQQEARHWLVAGPGASCTHRHLFSLMLIGDTAHPSSM